MTKLFTESEVISLCTAIRNRPSLYDPGDPNFGKSLANKAVWDEIALMFPGKGFTADDVKLKWKNLRDTMALLLRKSNRDPNTWRFYEYLSFLNNYERKPRKNGRKTPSTNGTSKDRPIKLSTPIGGLDRGVDEPPEKQFKPTMVVNSTVTKSEDIVEQSDSSRDSNFEDTHDSLLKHFVVQAQQGNIISSSNLIQTPQMQSPYPTSHMRERDVFDIFGEETAIRLRMIAESGNRTLFVHARRKINEVLDQMELEIYNKRGNDNSANEL